MASACSTSDVATACLSSFAGGIEGSSRQAMRSDSQQLGQAFHVVAHDDLPVDEHHGRCQHTEPLKFVEGGFVCRDVAVNKRDLMLVKELPHTSAEDSTRLRKEPH
jgi:hypothetical protein